MSNGGIGIVEVLLPGVLIRNDTYPFILGRKGAETFYMPPPESIVRRAT